MLKREGDSDSVVAAAAVRRINAARARLSLLPLFSLGHFTLALFQLEPKGQNPLLPDLRPFFRDPSLSSLSGKARSDARGASVPRPCPLFRLRRAGRGARGTTPGAQPEPAVRTRFAPAWATSLGGSVTTAVSWELRRDTAATRCFGRSLDRRSYPSSPGHRQNISSERRI